MENPNIGVVIAVDKRFYCTVELYEAREAQTALLDIQVESPQFGQTWSYKFDKEQKRLGQADASQSENGFVEKTLRVSLLALLDQEKHENLSQIKLTIKGDNDFYSLIPHLKERGECKSLSAALALPQFLPAPRVDGKIVKTGLGSSACLVSSVVASLWYSLKAYNGNDDDLEADASVDMIFRLAQISHCHSQGKVGSGFDVAAACYGTHIYERFPKALLADLLSQLDNNTSSTAKLQASVLCILQSTWDGGIRAPLTLPSFVQVLLADVSGGSESPSMARTVLAWKKNFGDVRVPHWDDLTRINQKIASLLQDIGSKQMNSMQLQSFIATKHESWQSSELGKALLELRAAAQESRRHLKAMGQAAGVPIEPDEQTRLVDATIEIPGVIAALVPGAGGYDAIACLYINHPTVQNAIADFWCKWSETSVCPLTVQCAQQGQGLRLETKDDISC